MFTAALFVIAKVGYNLNAPPTPHPPKKKTEQLSRLWCIQIVDFYDAVKKNEVDLYGLIWKNVHNI